MRDRGKQKHREVRRAQREAIELIESEHGDYTPPDRDLCRYREWVATVDDAYTIRAEYRIWRLRGDLTEFVVNLQRITLDGDWETVEYIDCCHGHCHLHPVSGGETTHIAKLDDAADVEFAFLQVASILPTRLRIIRDMRED